MNSTFLIISKILFTIIISIITIILQKYYDRNFESGLKLFKRIKLEFVFILGILSCSLLFWPQIALPIGAVAIWICFDPPQRLNIYLRKLGLLLCLSAICISAYKLTILNKQFKYNSDSNNISLGDTTANSLLRINSRRFKFNGSTKWENFCSSNYGDTISLALFFHNTGRATIDTLRVQLTYSQFFSLNNNNSTIYLCGLFRPDNSKYVFQNSVVIELNSLKPIKLTYIDSKWYKLDIKKQNNIRGIPSFTAMDFPLNQTGELLLNGQFKLPEFSAQDSIRYQLIVNYKLDSK